MSRYYLMILVFAVGCFLGCEESYTPKPRGYFRIEFPPKEYVQFKDEGPYSFMMPKYCSIQPDTTGVSEPWWNNLQFPTMKGTLHLSYKKVNNNLEKYVEDARTLVNKHIIKADGIEPEIYENDSNNVIAVLFEIKGNAASPFQFFATDSVNHFLRGSLYFNVYPNKDSLAPVFDFVKKDIIKLVETIKWRNADLP